MARITLTGGVGAQLWRIAHQYVELYPVTSWPPPGTPSEVWGKEVLKYNLPGGKLGGCLDGTLTVQADPARGLPGGFSTYTWYAGGPQGVRCTLTNRSRLVQVIAVLAAAATLPDGRTLQAGDEVVFATYGLGLVKNTAFNQFEVQLVDPSAFWADELPADRTTAPPFPTSSPYTTPGQVFGAYSGPSGTDWTAGITYREWWQTAFQNFPDATLEVGPDLRWLAGRAQFGNPAQYAADYRMQDLQGQGAEVPPYLSHVRQWTQGNSLFVPPVIDQSRAMGLLDTRRVAVVEGSLNSATSTMTSEWSGNLTGSQFQVNGANSAGVEWRANLPVLSSLDNLKAASVSLSISLATVVAPMTLRIFMQQHYPNGSFGVIGQQEYEVTRPWSGIIKFDPSPKALQGADYVLASAVGRGSSSSSQVLGTVSVAEASYSYDHTVYSASYGDMPVGLQYPLQTDEAWTFRLPGIHRGPYRVTGLPGGLTQYATTVNTADERGFWTEFRCGPLPYQSSPVQFVPERRQFTRAIGKVKSA